MAERLELRAHHDAQLASGLRVAVVLLEGLAQLATRNLLRADQDDAHAASCDPKERAAKVSSRAMEGGERGQSEAVEWMRVERVTCGSRQKRASGGRGRTIAVERFGRIEQALHHLSKPRELDREVELE